MGYVATYLNESQFEVYHLEGAVRTGDVLDDLRIGTVLLCEMGVDGQKAEHVEVAIYDAGGDVTRITVRYDRLTANLTEVFRGPLFVDTENHISNLSEHDHSAEWQGGNKPFGLFTDAAIVARLIALGEVAPAVANFLWGVNAAGTGVEKKGIVGTDKRVTVNHATGLITLSGPQDLSAADSPEFTGLKLSGLTGLLVGRGATANLIALAASAANQVPRWNTGNDAWEMVNFALANMKDVTVSSPTDGQSLIYSAGKWINALVGGGSGGLSRAETIALINAIGGDGGSGVAEPHAGDHIAGGSDIIDGDKIDIDYSPANYTPVTTPVSDAVDQLASHLAGLAAELLVPDPRAYCPEPFCASSDTQITLRPGTYYFEGYRHGRKYEKRNVRSRTISTNTAVTVSSYVTGGVVNSSWYAVFLKNTNQTILPFIRVKSVALDGGNTKIEIGQQDDHTTTEDGFLTANDQFNGMRLLKWSVDAYSGSVYTVADSVNQTGDYLVITGDKTAEIAAGDWLQFLPAPETDLGTAYLYLGVIRIGDTGNIIECNRKLGTWLYEYVDDVEKGEVGGNLSTSPGNTLISPFVPPNAIDCQLDLNVSSNTNSVNAIGVYLYRGNAGTLEQKLPSISTGMADAKTLDVQLFWPISYPCILRNNFWQDSGAASFGFIYILEFSE